MTCSIIYIPIWFYSNKVSDDSTYIDSRFTFQYGSIQMVEDVSATNVYASFTFQYGSIQMKCSDDSTYVDSKFTFQYGSIQIEVCSKTLIDTYNIYIPIWFYSNGFIKLVL